MANQPEIFDQKISMARSRTAQCTVPAIDAFPAMRYIIPSSASGCAAPPCFVGCTSMYRVRTGARGLRAWTIFFLCADLVTTIIIGNVYRRLSLLPCPVQARSGRSRTDFCGRMRLGPSCICICSSFTLTYLFVLQ